MLFQLSASINSLCFDVLGNQAMINDNNFVLSNHSDAHHDLLCLKYSITEEKKNSKRCLRFFDDRSRHCIPSALPGQEVQIPCDFYDIFSQEEIKFTKNDGDMEIPSVKLTCQSNTSWVWDIKACEKYCSEVFNHTFDQHIDYLSRMNAERHEKCLQGFCFEQYSSTFLLVCSRPLKLNGQKLKWTLCIF